MSCAAKSVVFFVNLLPAELFYPLRLQVFARWAAVGAREFSGAQLACEVQLSAGSDAAVDVALRSGVDGFVATESARAHSHYSSKQI